MDSKAINSNKQIKIGMILSYLTILVGIVTGLVYTPWMLSILGDSDYGVYTIANSIISIFLMDFGLSVAVTRYTAKYIENNDFASLRMFYGVINRLYFFIDCIIAIAFIIFFFLSPVIYQALSSEEIYKLRIIYCFLAFYSLLSFQFIPSDGILSAYEEFTVFKATTLVVKVFTVLLTALLLFLGYGLYAIVGCHIIFGVFGIVFKKIYIIKKLKLTPDYKARRTISYKELGKFAGWITVIQLGDRLFLSIVPTLLGSVSGSYEVTVFGLAITIESFIFSIINVANTLFFARVSRTYNFDDEELTKTTDLMVTVGKLQTFISGLIICGFICLGQPFVSIWTRGDLYPQVYWVILFIVIPVCIEQSQGVQLLILQIIGKLKEIAISTLVFGVINVLLVLLLGYFYGAFGAGIALLVSKLCKILINNFIFVKIGKLKVLKVYLKTYIVFIPTFIVTLIIGLLVNYYLPVNGIFILVLYSLIITFVYSLFTWFISLSKGERKSILKYIKSKIVKRRSH